MVSPDQLLGGSHSYRNYSPEKFREAAENGELYKLRKALKHMEDGRFHRMLKATHKMYAALDPDERREFWRQHPNLMEWVNVYAMTEELMQFTKHKPDDL